MARSKYADIELRTMEEISKSIQLILKANGMSQTELSDKTGLSTSTISDYVNGRTLISPSNLQKVADALNVKCTFMRLEIEGFKREEI